MNIYQKKINKLTKQYMFMSPDFNLKRKFRKIRKNIRKCYAFEISNKDYREIKSLMKWKRKFKEELKNENKN